MSSDLVAEMEDIRLAIALMAFISIAAFTLTYRLFRHQSHLILDVSAFGIVCTIVAYVYVVWGQLWIVKWIPLPSVIILSNWFPPLLASLAAVVWIRLLHTTVLRRLPVMLMLFVAAVYSLTYFIPTEAPECGDEWVRPNNTFLLPVCRQTTKFTCSAAAAATVLNAFGIPATEQEMARLCLTRSGTTWLGLYHGLSTKLLGTNLRVTFLEGEIQDLERHVSTSPILLCCRLDPQVAEQAPEYVNTGGWIPGTAHTVVYFGRIGDKHLIGDPSQGYEAWSTQDLSLLWTGTGLSITELPVASETEQN